MRFHINNQYKSFSKKELLSFLAKQNVDVPDRSRERRPAVERRIMFRILATLAEKNFLYYPFELIYQDNPDFLLRYDDHEVGFECTEAVSREYAETDALMEREGISGNLSECYFRPGTPKRTAYERRKLIQNRPHNPGWGDDGMVRDWASAIYESIKDKTKAFRKPEFQKFDKNLLLVWSNLPGIVRNINNAMNYLEPKLNCYWPDKNRYDKFLIDMGSYLVKIQPEQ